MHPDQPVYHKPLTPAPRTTSPLDPWLPPLDNTCPFVAADGRAFVGVPAASLAGLRYLPVRSDAFRDWYFAQTNGTLNKLPNSRTFNNVCQYLEAGAARIPTNRCTVYRRIGKAGDATLHIDLSNPAGEYIEITPAGYTVRSDDNGLAFETSAQNLAIPAPKPAESTNPLELLRTTLNLHGSDWLRCLTWVLSALNPNGPYPILVLRGPSGSGKTVAGRTLRSIVDPSTAPLAAMPHTATQLLHLARQSWALAFDHVSHITPSLADALCRITSGVGLATREPGRRDLVQHWIKRPVVLTVTESCELPPDLAARALVVTLPELGPETRLPEYDLLTPLNQAYSEIFAALCDALSRALANYRPIPASTRHATALSWAVAALPHLAAELAAAIMEPSPPPAFLAQLNRFLAANPHWEGTAASLLPHVRAAESPKGVSQALNKHALALADAGIRIATRRAHEGRRLLLLDASPAPVSPMSSSSSATLRLRAEDPPSSSPPPNGGTFTPHEIRPPDPNHVDFYDNKVL